MKFRDFKAYCGILESFVILKIKRLEFHNCSKLTWIFVALQPEKLGTGWQYIIEWYPGGSSNQQSLVKLTSQPRYGEDDIVLHLWTNSHSQTSDIVTSQQPLAIYAQVLKGTRNVLNAHVEVTVTVTKPDGTGNTINLRLKDDGSGGT